jgi:hypothetical protein
MATVKELWDEDCAEDPLHGVKYTYPDSVLGYIRVSLDSPGLEELMTDAWQKHESFQNELITTFSSTPPGILVFPGKGSRKRIYVAFTGEVADPEFGVGRLVMYSRVIPSITIVSLAAFLAGFKG